MDKECEIQKVQLTCKWAESMSTMTRAGSRICVLYYYTTYTKQGVKRVHYPVIYFTIELK